MGQKCTMNRPPKRSWRRLVLVGAHDRHYPASGGRIIGAVRHIGRVVIDLPEVAATGLVDRAKIMLAMRVIIVAP